jgi:hypothetical protein
VTDIRLNALSGEIMDNLMKAAHSQNKNLLLTSLRQYDSHVGCCLSRANTQLNSAAGQLDVHPLVDLLERVGENLGPRFDENGEECISLLMLECELATHITSLMTFNRQLSELIGLHDVLQGLSDAFRISDPLHSCEITELLLAMEPTVNQMRETPYMYDIGDFLAAYPITGHTDSPSVSLATFKNLQSVLNQTFNRADRDLLLVCQRLPAISSALGRVLQTLDT